MAKGLELDILKEMDVKTVSKQLTDLRDFLSGEEVVNIIKPMALELTKKEVSIYAPNRVDRIFARGVSKTIRIYARDPVLIYNEYGTGIMGLNNPHPDAAFIGWDYDTKFRGNRGWWYETDSSDRNPIKRVMKNENGELVLKAWTKGLPARMGFYRARDKIGIATLNKLHYKINGLLEMNGVKR